MRKELSRTEAEQLFERLTNNLKDENLSLLLWLLNDCKIGYDILKIKNQLSLEF